MSQVQRTACGSIRGAQARRAPRHRDLYVKIIYGIDDRDLGLSIRGWSMVAGHASFGSVVPAQRLRLMVQQDRNGGRSETLRSLDE